MRKEEIHLWDIKRILFGQAPPEFLLEIFIRTLIIYVATLIVLRYMGKRMDGQLTIIELAVMVMIGTVVSVLMQMADRGLLQGLVVLLVTLFCLRSINWISFRNYGFEKLVQGEVSMLVKDEVLQVDELRRTKLTNQQVFSELRNKNIFNLGRVKRMYQEASGVFSIYEHEEPKPDLPVFPQVDETLYENNESTSREQKDCCECTPSLVVGQVKLKEELNPQIVCFVSIGWMIL